MIIADNCSLAVLGAIVGDDWVILVKSQHAKNQNKWQLPGGFVESGESPVEAMIREIREELGVSVEKIDPVGMYVRRNERRNDIAIAFRIGVLTDKFTIDTREIPADGIMGYYFDKLPEITPRTRQILEDIRDNRSLRIWYSKNEYDSGEIISGSQNIKISSHDLFVKTKHNDRVIINYEAPDILSPMQQDSLYKPVKYKCAVSGCFLKDSKCVLLVRTRHEQLKGNCYWQVPGGFVEGGERLSDAMHREFKEEFGIPIQIKYPVGVYIRNDQIAVLCMINMASHDLLVNPNHEEIVDVGFFDLDNLKDLEMKLRTRQMLDDVTKGYNSRIVLFDDEKSLGVPI